MKKSSALKKQAPPPKRKIGRYVLLLVVSLPLLFQARHLNIDVPSVDFDFDFALPSISVEDEVKFTNVVIDGDLQYSSKETLKSNLSERIKTDFVRLDLSQIQASLLENTWYRNVSVSRVWPSSLKVSIEEQQPIARWGEEGFINRYGEVVTNGDQEQLQHLPLLEGKPENAYDIAKNYLTISQLMIDEQLYITKLIVSESQDWSLEVNHDFSIVLGQRDMSSRIARFLYLYKKQLAPLNGEFESVDMRYQSGVAVKWKKQALAAIQASSTIASR